MSSSCPKGHLINTSQDRVNGYCRKCQLEDSRRYRLKQKAAIDLVRALADRGVHIDIDTMALGTDPTATPQAVADRLVAVFGPSID